MIFNDDQLSLISAAEEFVVHCMNDGGSFLMFGLVMQQSGEINLAQPSDEFESESAALEAVKAHMHEVASAGAIRACLVCSPVVALNQIVAVFIQAESSIGSAAAFVSRCKQQGNGTFVLGGRDPAPAQAFAFVAAQQCIQPDGPASGGSTG